MPTSMRAFKELEPDGFQAMFYQTQWEVVGDALFDLVQKLFLNPQLIGEINETLITLIPKVDNVVKMKGCWPISNVSYKVITKILSHQLRPSMETLVSPCQCSFIPNCQSRDNILIPPHFVSKKVCECTNAQGFWDMQLVSPFLDAQTLDIIRVIPTQRSLKGDDCLALNGTPYGNFENGRCILESIWE